MLTFEQLLAFQAIIRARTFRRAADELFLTQPAISQRIRHLEQALGVELFHRDGNRRALRLTPAGECVLRAANEMLSILEQLRLDIRSASEMEGRETITIASSPTPAKYILPNILMVYHERHPFVRVNFVQSSTEKIGGIVRAGEAQLGVVIDGYVEQGLHVVPLFRDQAVLIAARGSPIFSDPELWGSTIRRCPFISGAPGSNLQKIARQWAATLHMELDMVVEAESLDFLKEAVFHGLGLAIVPQLCVSDEVRDGRLRIVFAPGLPLEMPFCLVFDPNRTPSPAVRALLDVIQEGTWRAYLPVPKAV